LDVLENYLDVLENYLDIQKNYFAGRGRFSDGAAGPFFGDGVMREAAVTTFGGVNRIFASPEGGLNTA
jgi:hypothetical protein